MTASILVRGGTGALGRPVARRLRDAGADLTVLSHHSRETAEGIRYTAGDLNFVPDPAPLRYLFRSPNMLMRMKPAMKNMVAAKYPSEAAARSACLLMTRPRAHPDIDDRSCT